MQIFHQLLWLSAANSVSVRIDLEHLKPCGTGFNGIPAVGDVRVEIGRAGGAPFVEQSLESAVILQPKRNRSQFEQTFEIDFRRIG